MSAERALRLGLTIRDASDADQAQWPGCDRVLSDSSTSTPLYPGEDEEAAARQWMRATSGLS